ncbi:glycoside hydrolase family 13 protein [Salibacterium salarium]|uniref:Glycoside hydrolase family 13 protein n=1 Tax=Salibacterium salarium TaxID=284579 RepID=A0A3R9QNA7_9BACI|nr:glycoside hydrolase family 13 protein [Salibacterium salarium]RSL34055.1 glycoside hydrolase family 13 protein [Salibacterium salarium]
MRQKDLYHNSFDVQYREPFGAAPRGSGVSLTIDVHQRHPVSEVILHYICDKKDVSRTQEMDLTKKAQLYHRYETKIMMPENPQLLWYFFEIVTDYQSFYYGREEVFESGRGHIYDHIPPSWQITVYDPDYQTPKWWKHATMYQIFPDRFNRAGEVDLTRAPKTSLMHTHWDNDPVYIFNEQKEVTHWDFFGGNLQGIIEKLDYLQSLGVTVLYLNPIFEAESNHRYDTADYHAIDPLLGKDKDFKELISKAADHNIEVMLDGVFSHTGSNSKYFNREGKYHTLGAYQSKKSRYYDWYTFYKFPDHYETWWGVGTMPAVNKENKDYQNFLIHDDDSVIQTWQRSGMKHWRLDVADELTDDLIKQIYQQLKKEDESSVLLGEVWEDATNKTAYGKRRDYFLGGVLDSVMNYPLRRVMLEFVKGDIDAGAVHRKLMTLCEHYPKHSFYSVMNMLSSHDVERIQTMLDDFLPPHQDENREEIVQQQVKALSLWLYTFPGVPSLYYGDEAGLTGGEDPDNRKPFPWGKEDQELVSWYQTLGTWRKKHPALRTGNWKSHAVNSDVYSFERWITKGKDEFGGVADDEHFLYLYNRNYTEKKDVELHVKEGEWQHKQDHTRIVNAKNERLNLTLEPNESMLLRRMEKD